MGGVDISLPNVSYCNDVKDVHYNPYNTVEFYVGEISGTTPQTVKIYTDDSTSVDVEISEGNKWYSYVLPKDKGLYFLGDSKSLCPIEKLNVKADIINDGNQAIISDTTVEASFKGSNTNKVTTTSWMFQGCYNLTSLDVSSFNTSKVIYMESMFEDCSGLTSLDISNFDTSNVTSMNGMFASCIGLTSLDLSGWDTSNVTNTSAMFRDCTSLKTIRMKGCNQTTIQKITDVKPSGATIVTE